MTQYVGAQKPPGASQYREGKPIGYMKVNSYRLLDPLGSDYTGSPTTFNTIPCCAITRSCGGSATISASSVPGGSFTFAAGYGGGEYTNTWTFVFQLPINLPGTTQILRMNNCTYTGPSGVTYQDFFTATSLSPGSGGRGDDNSSYNGNCSNLLSLSNGNYSYNVIPGGYYGFGRQSIGNNANSLCTLVIPNFYLEIDYKWKYKLEMLSTVSTSSGYDSSSSTGTLSNRVKLYLTD